jgi:uncharacterized protein
MRVLMDDGLGSSRQQRRAGFELGLFLAGFYVLWTVRATWGYALDASIDSLVLRAAYADVLKLVLWVVPAFAFAHWLRGAPAVKYLGLSVLPNLRTWGLCLAVTGGFLVAVAVFEIEFGRKIFAEKSLRSLMSSTAVLQLVISPGCEEILFRGLILKEFMNLLPTAWANMLTSLLFVGIHLPFWLTHAGLGQGVVVNAAGVFVFSLLAGWLYAKSRSVWPPTVAHIANNLLTSFLS